jgi:hypothetical protein
MDTTMGHRLLTSVFTVWISLLFGVLWNTQSIQTTQEFAPTPVDSDDLRVFPSNLVCDRREVTRSDIGPSWMGITIGQSTLADVERLLSTLSDDYSLIDEDTNNIRFIIFELSQRESDIPSAVRLCLVESVVVVLAATYNADLTAPTTKLSDLIVEFGEPDTITWTDSSATRVVFWFEQGFSAEVNVLPNDPNYPQLQPTFGRVLRQIYFPYQEAADYENRWPYNQTRPFNQFLAWPYQDYDEYGPENPFDFESMIATITAEPVRTVTPQLAMPTATASP